MILNIRSLCVLMFLSVADAALFGEQCTSSSECTDANTECVKYRACTVGTCQCKTGYGNANGNACDKTLRHYNEQCDIDHICLDSNQECDSATGRCACSTWNTYHYLVQGCITVTRYVLTEACGGWWQLQCYIADADGGLCDDTCQCQSGFTMAIWESYLVCRAPQYGEYCTSGISCDVSFDTSTVSNDTSSTAPRCLLNECLCPPSHEHKVVMGNHLCLNKVNDDYVLKEDGDNCTSFNECESSLCVRCLGSETGVCMPNDDAVNISPNVLLVVVVTAAAAFKTWFVV